MNPTVGQVLERLDPFVFGDSESESRLLEAEVEFWTNEKPVTDSFGSYKGQWAANAPALTMV